MTMKTMLMAGAAALAFKAAAAAPVEAPDLGLAFKRTDTVSATCFVPIYRVDAETRTVYGRLADETPDLTGMIFDYDTSAPLFKTWTDNAMKTTAGKSAGNLRVMHGLKVAGKLTEVTFDDAAKTIDIAAEVVDEAEWEMVEKGCYTGFSLGGRYVKKWKDKGDAKKTRYTVNPFEASLVDLPCIPTATFAMKTATGEEQVEFVGWVPTDEQISAKAAEIAGEGVEVTDEHTGAALKALEAEYVAAAAEAGIPDEVVQAAETGEEPEAQAEKTAPAPGSPEADAAEGLAQMWVARDGSQHATKAAARDHHAALDAAAAKAADPVAAAVAALKGAIDPAAAGAEAATEDAPTSFVVDGAAEAFADFLAVKAAYDDQVANKGIYDVKNLAQIIQELNWLTSNSICEAGQEKDGSAVPAALMSNLRGLSNTLVAMAKEETAEMIAQLQKLGADVQVFATDTASKAVTIDLGEAAKAEGDEATPTVITVPAELSEAIAAKFAAMPADEEADEPVDGEAFKALSAENTALKAQMTDEVLPALGEATKTIADMRAELDAFKAMPMPGAARTDGGRVVSKEADADPSGAQKAPIGGTPDEVIQGLIATHGADVVSRALIKSSHAQPMRMG